MNFTDLELSILGEVGNVSVGGAAASLSDFVNKIVTISIPNTKKLKFKDIKKEIGTEVFYAKIDYEKGLEGSNILLLKTNEAFQLAKLAGEEKLGFEITEWDSFSKNIIAEVFNIMAGNMSNSMSGLLRKEVKINTPVVDEIETEELKHFSDEEELVVISFDIKIENIFKMKLMKLVTKDQAISIIESIRGENSL